MEFTLIGSAAAPGIPVYGCKCPACQLARQNPTLQRQKTSAMIQHNNKRLLIDANADDFMTRFPQGSYDGILLTHFHMDHVSALFDIRWGIGEPIPVYIPADQNGADDLFKHSGLLDFKTLPTFQPWVWEGITITPVALNHSRPTHGYVFDYQDKRLTYLTDTAWLAEETLSWLSQKSIDYLFLDTSHAPSDKPPRNHHDVMQAKQLFEQLKPNKMGLIHVTHDVLNWQLANPDFFNQQFFIAMDGDTLTL